MSQDTLFEIINEALPDIEQELLNCCGVEVDDITRAQVEGDEEIDEKEEKEKGIFFTIKLFYH